MLDRFLLWDQALAPDWLVPEWGNGDALTDAGGGPLLVSFRLFTPRVLDGSVRRTCRHLFITADLFWDHAPTENSPCRPCSAGSLGEAKTPVNDDACDRSFRFTWKLVRRERNEDLNYGEEESDSSSLE